MKYTYGIQCHQITNPLRFLLSALCNNPDSIVLVHVDQKADLDPFINEFSHYPNFTLYRIELMSYGVTFLKLKLHLVY
jgi:hypothetical protein